LKVEVDWRNLLKYFIGIAFSRERTSTIKRINKKAPYVFPGSRRKTIAKIAFFIDQSGSMSNEDVQLAMGAAFSCSRETEIDVFNFDTSVDENSHQIWKRGKSTVWQRTRSGGTDFNGVRQFLIDNKRKHKYNLVAIVTDGYAAPMDTLIGTKFIWLITPTGTMEAVASGEMVVKMKHNEKSIITRK
jgi:predicted metal-dependent peptidase